MERDGPFGHWETSRLNVLETSHQSSALVFPSYADRACWKGWNAVACCRPLLPPSPRPRLQQVPTASRGWRQRRSLHIYGFDTAATDIGAVGGTGAGQTIALVEAYHSPTLPADLQTFDTEYSLPAVPSLKEVNESGGSTLPASNILWSVETSLDLEWAHAVAPGANIVVVEAASSQLGDLLAAADTARNLPGVSVVSMSWGVDEFTSETSFDSLFTTPAGHDNITFVASAGDTSVATGVQWPAASPNVVSVGGTTLAVDAPSSAAAVATATEATYSGSISGVSSFESTPVYQQGSSTPAGRRVPDVVYNADPLSGFSVYSTAGGGWQTLGGTSAGAPQWAALVAIADQMRATAGQSTLDGVSQTLPQLYQLQNSGSATAALSNAASASAQSTPTLTGPAPQAPASKTTARSIIVARVRNSSAAAAALSLTTAAGKPKASQIITALANLPSQTVAASQNPLAAGESAKRKLPKHAVHLFFLNTLAGPPSVAVAAIAPPVASLASCFQISTAEIAVAAAPSTSRPSAIEATISSPPAAPSALARALADGAGFGAGQALALVQSFSSFFQSIAYVTAPYLFEAPIVPVTEQGAADAMAVGSFYIAHVDVSRVFGDAMASFVNECIGRRAVCIEGGGPPPDHSRAWWVTAGVVVVDAIVLGYVVQRHRRRLRATACVRWWEDPSHNAEPFQLAQ